MFTLLKMFFVILSLFILTGCSEKHLQNKVIQKDKTIQKELPPKIDKKERIKNKECKKHIQIMEHALEYVLKEFDEGYFVSKDIVGAKAQLFLIENSSPTPFAKNINTAQNSYTRQLNMAKKKGCEIKSFTKDPLLRIKEKIKQFESKKDVEEK